MRLHIWQPFEQRQQFSRIELKLLLAHGANVFAVRGSCYLKSHLNLVNGRSFLPQVLASVPRRKQGSHV